MRYFIIEWYEKKDKQKIARYNKVIVNGNYEDIGIAAHAATEMFSNNFGSLKYNEILSIQEVDKEDNPIGEVIKPMEGTSIVPTGR